MKNILATYIYPAAIHFFQDFIQSINEQDCKNFELIIFNDGVIEPKSYFDNLKVNYEIVEVVNLSINGVRDYSINYLKNRNDIEKIIFQDIDDMASSNRFSILIEVLNSYPLVCNDLMPFGNNRVVESGIWKERLGDNFSFDWKFIKDYNIVGLGNSAILHSLLKNQIEFDDTIKAYDWFFFYQLMKKSGCKGVFTNQCQTLYRQYDSNIAGSWKTIDYDRLQYVIKLKNTHYKALIHLNFDELNESLIKLNQQKHILKNFKSIYHNKSLFWWEETELI